MSAAGAAGRAAPGETTEHRMDEAHKLKIETKFNPGDTYVRIAEVGKDKRFDCSVCGGTGKLRRVDSEEVIPCEKCRGTGAQYIGVGQEWVVAGSGTIAKVEVSATPGKTKVSNTIQEGSNYYPHHRDDELFHTKEDAHAFKVKHRITEEEGFHVVGLKEFTVKTEKEVADYTIGVISAGKPTKKPE